MRFYDSEIKVLEVLWEHGELTAGQIAEILGKEDGWSYPKEISAKGPRK